MSRILKRKITWGEKRGGKEREREENEQMRKYYVGNNIQASLPCHTHTYPSLPEANSP